MPAVAPCPPSDALERWLVGRVGGDQADEIEGHVGTCRTCATTLRSLTPADALVAALRPPLGPADLPFCDRVEALIPCLKQLRPQDGTASWGAADADATQASVESVPTAPLGQPDGRVGKYELLGPIGAGGMGVVFRAEDTVLRRRVALKLIQPSLVRSATARDRFLREAQALAQLEHDHVVAVYEADEADGSLFLAMPLLRGRTLQARLNEAAGPLPVDELLRVGREIAAGLAAAHARGIVHRDIKPANVWLDDGTDPPRVKVLDFGLAQALTDESAEQPGTVLGTPAYMAPEQAAGSAVDGRADLFSLGCVLYQMATGRRPFAGPNLVALILSVSTDEPTPVGELTPELPPALTALITTLLHKAPAARPPSADTVVAELAAIEEARRPRVSRRKWLAWSAAAVLLTTAVGAYAAYRWGSAPPAPGEVTFDYPEADGRLALQLEDGPERVIDVRAEPVVSLPPGDYAVRAVAAPGALRVWPGRVLVGAGEKAKVALRLVGLVAEHKQHSPHALAGLALREVDGRLTVLSVGHDRTLVAWVLGTPGRPLQVLDPTAPFRCAALSPDGKVLAVGLGDVGPGAVRAVRFRDAATLQPLPGELPAKGRDQVDALAYSRDGRFLFTGQSDGTVSRWDVRLGVAEEEQVHCDSGVHAVALSHDGTHVFTAGGDGTVAGWHAADLKPVRRYAGATGAVRALAVMPGDKLVAAAGDDCTVRVWDRATGAAAAEWAVPAAVTALAASPDGTRLATGDAGGTVRVWDAARRAELVNFPGHAKVSSIAFTRDGRRVVSAAADGADRVWSVP